ncbi:MAG: TonB-dependent receptor [Ignavibacteriae bacterium]|nr:TonB-dependent receptor [Ignavibacteriota bacterium]
MAAHSLLRPLPLLCFLFQATVAAFSSEAKTISGVVTDSTTGEIVAGAQVFLRTTESKEALRRTTTNRLGFYLLANIAAGRYRLVARGYGNAFVERTVVVPDTVADVRFDLQLLPATYELREIVIESERLIGSAPLSLHSISPQVMKSLPSIGGEPDVFRPLQYLPGVKTSSELLGGMHVRGSSPDQNLVLLDGMPLLNPSHFGGLLGVFNPDIVRSVELSKGVLDAMYGGKASSVLNVATKEGSRERIGGSAGLSMLSTRVMLEGPLTENASFIIAGRRLYADLLVPVFTTSTSIPRYYFYDLNAKIRQSFSPTDRLVLSAYVGHDVLTRSRDNDVNFDIDWGNGAAGANWLHTFSPTIIMNVAAVYSKYDFSTRIYSDTSKGYTNWMAKSALSDLQLKTDFEILPGDMSSFKMGGEVVRSRHYAEALDELDFQRRGEMAPRTTHSIDAALYVQAEMQATEALRTVAGLRLNSFADGTFTHLEPRLSVSLALSDAMLLRSSFAIVHQYLHLVTRNELSLPTDLWLRSDKNIQPARTIQTSAGIEMKFFDQDYLLSLDGYFKSSENLFEYRESADAMLGVPTKENLTMGTGEAYGVELLLRKDVGGFNGWLAYTLSWTRRTFDELNGGRPYFAKYDSRHDVSVVASYKASDRWHLSATWTHNSGQPYTLPTGQFVFPPFEGSRYYLDFSERNARRLPAYHKLDIGATYSFTWFDLPFELVANIYNVYNHQNVIARYLKFEGRGWVSSPPKATVKDLTLFPFLPTVGLSCTF